MKATNHGDGSGDGSDHQRDGSRDGEPDDFVPGPIRGTVPLMDPDGPQKECS